MPKRTKKERIEPSGNVCAWSGCNDEGNFRAPASKKNLRQYQWFCEAHIREFNKQWNYFEGMSQNEIYEFQKDAVTGHRPTWRMDEVGTLDTQRLEDAFSRMFGETPRQRTRANGTPVGARDKDALAVLDLEHPADKKSIKSQYRELAKKYHPDTNRGNKRAEETFKKITHAYHHLMAHYVEGK